MCLQRDPFKNTLTDVFVSSKLTASNSLCTGNKQVSLIRKWVTLVPTLRLYVISSPMVQYVHYVTHRLNRSVANPKWILTHNPCPHSKPSSNKNYWSRSSYWVAELHITLRPIMPKLKLPALDRSNDLLYLRVHGDFNNIAVRTSALASKALGKK